MSDLPTIAILFMTKEVPGREGIAIRTIDALKKNLFYDATMDFFIADGGSSWDYGIALTDCASQKYNSSLHSQKSSPGFCWNTVIRNIFGYHYEIYLRMEDDMVLHDKLDITPYVKLLMEKERVGMVRLALMPIGLDLHSTAHDGRIYFNVKKSTPYFYSGHPGLIHKRLHDTHGYFDENANPGEIEVNFDHRLRHEEGPEIWMPWDLGGYENTFGVFNHIGEVQSYD